MQIINQLERYYRFSKAEVFDKLQIVLTNKCSLLMSFQAQVEEQVQIIDAQIKLLSNQKPNWKNYGEQFDLYVQVFQIEKKGLEMEAQNFGEMRVKTEQKMLMKLRECEMAYNSIHSTLFKSSYDQLQSYKSKKQLLHSRISTIKTQIQSYKEHIFTRMLQFARDLSQSNIKKKLNQEYDLATYGKMSAEVKNYLDGNLFQFEENIFQLLSKIREKEVEEEEYVRKIVRGLYGAEAKRVGILKDTVLEMNSSVEIIKTQIVAPLIELEKVTIPKRGTLTHSSRMDTAVHVALHPLSQKQLLVSHRQSLHQQIRIKQICKQKHTHFICPSKPPQEAYALFKPFIIALNSCIESSFLDGELCPEQIQKEVEEIKKAFRFKDFRELLIFYLYYQVKQGRNFHQKEESLMLELCNSCLKESFKLFDSQSIIKLLLVSLQVKGVEQNPYYLKLDLSNFLGDFQFWETAFIQNIYEYCEVMVSYYQQIFYLSNKLDNKKEGKNFWGMFKPINWFNHKHHEAKSKKQIRDIYPQIIRNTFTIYMSLMRVFQVPAEVLNKLVEYLKTAISKLKFTEEEEVHLKKKLKKMLKIETYKLMDLLKNQFLIQRALSKLLGRGDEGPKQKNEMATLSESILKWQGDQF